MASSTPPASAVPGWKNAIRKVDRGNWIRVTTYYWHRHQRVQVCLNERVSRCRCVDCGGLNRGSVVVAQDSRVYTVSEANVTDAGVRPDPVVANRLVGLELP